MKLSHFFLLALISTMMTVVACKDNKDAATTEGGIAQDSIISPEGTMTSDPAMAVTPPSGGSEAHYTCTKAGCTGSGAAQGKCPVCGTDLVHNQAFHAQAAGTPGSSPVNPVQVNPTGGTATTPTATPTPPSSQNAKGEYHYTCAKGHAGAASAGNCGTCGEPLAHNQAYHNN